jgi:hypothetical protein
MILDEAARFGQHMPLHGTASRQAADMHLRHHRIATDARVICGKCRDLSAVAKTGIGSVRRHGLHSWTQFSCVVERSRYLVAARRLLAALERSMERRVDQYDLERLLLGATWSPCNSHSPELLAYESCYALLEAQHSSSYMLRRALAPLELRPPHTSSLQFAFLTNCTIRGRQSIFARSFAIRAQLGESVCRVRWRADRLPEPGGRVLLLAWREEVESAVHGARLRSEIGDISRLRLTSLHLRDAYVIRCNKRVDWRNQSRL